MRHGWPKSDGFTPRNIKSQCENIEVENQDTVSVGPYHVDGVFSLRKFFGLDVRTSDPLLNVVKWIAFFTKVPCFEMRDGSVTSFLQIGAIVIFAWPLILLLVVFFTVFGVCITDMGAYRKINYFVERSMEAVLLNFVLVFPYFLSYICVKPSRHLLLGIQQLSALKFLPWMLTALIHSLPLAYFYHCYMTKSTTTLPWPFERILWTDLTCWHWAIGGVVSTLILTPQFLVLAAVIRVRRLNNERRKIESLPPSYSSLEHSYPTLPPSYSTLEVLQGRAEYFKT
jgi:hypothetical protein